MNAIYSIIFMSMTLRLESALSIGTGERECIVCDEQGNPYIPATSLAGVLRHAMKAEDGNALFGHISLERGHSEAAILSKIKIEDAMLDGAWKPVFREGVELDDYHTAAGNHKYRVFAVDRGARFHTQMELEFETREDEERLLPAFLRALSGLHAGELTMGKKSTRGMGSIRIESCRMKAYRGETLLDSIDHTPDREEPVVLHAPTESDAEKLCYTIRLRNTLCVREYVPLAYRGAGSQEPNYIQMMSGGKAVIPGTSWAGVFRHGTRAMLMKLGISAARSKALCSELFGDAGKNVERIAASSVRFADTFFEPNCIRGTRTAIDRCMGGAARGALYTEDALVSEKETCAGVIQIFVRKGRTCTGWGTDMMRLLLRELDEGRLHVGGNGSIGRGLFRVDGLKEDDRYPELAALVRCELEQAGEMRG